MHSLGSSNTHSRHSRYSKADVILSVLYFLSFANWVLHIHLIYLYYLFIYFGCAGSFLRHVGSFFLVAACGLLSWGMWTLSCDMWTLSCGMQSLSCGMRVGSSFPTRDQTQAPCIGRPPGGPHVHLLKWSLFQRAALFSPSSKDTHMDEEGKKSYKGGNKTFCFIKYS